MPRKKAEDYWDPRWYVKIFILAKSGQNNLEIAKILGMPEKKFWEWTQKDEAIKDALMQAREIDTKNSVVHPFYEYTIGELSPEVRDLWEKFVGADVSKDWTDRQKVLALLDENSEKTRQKIFLNAYRYCNYHLPRAARMAGTNTTQVEKWSKNDPEFCTLMAEVDQELKFFFQSCLVKICEKGDNAGIIFANKTKNRDMGYDQGTKEVNVNVKGQIGINHDFTDLSVLYPFLKPETQKDLLEAFDKYEESKKAIPVTPVEVLKLPIEKIETQEIFEADWSDRNGKNIKDTTDLESPPDMYLE